MKTSQGAFVIVQGEHGTSKTMLINEVSQELSKATPKVLANEEQEKKNKEKKNE